MLIKQSHIWRDSEFWDAPLIMRQTGSLKVRSLQDVLCPAFTYAFERVRPIIDISVD